MKDYFDEYWVSYMRAKRAESALEKEYGKDVKLAQHLSDVEDKNAKLKHNVRFMQVALEDRNNQLSASKLVVWCSGGCEGGVPDPDHITEEIVREAEINAIRLREWWENRKCREANKQQREKDNGDKS